MNDSITYTGLPIKGFGTFKDNHGNEIDGNTLTCNAEAPIQISTVESVRIHAGISPYNTGGDLGALVRNLFAVEALDLGETVSPLQTACEDRSARERE